MDAARSLSLFFAAGALGGLVSSLALWLFGELGLDHTLGVSIAPELRSAWLYPRLVWGGLWGFVFVLPVQLGWLARGLVLSLAPSLVQLLVIFPLRAHKGVLGLELGLLTPVVVLLCNALWGLVASWWIRGTRG
jgi:hypothetical protein